MRALLFDLDGTLVDSTEDLVASGNWLRARAGLPPHPAATVASFVGDGVEALVRRLLGAPGGDVSAEVEAFMLHYREHCLDRTRLCPGAAEALAALGGRHRLAVVTNKPERVSRRILEGLGVAGLFGSVVGGNTCPRKKPHPEPLLKACVDLGVGAGEAAMVGDSRVDVEAGRAAGMPTLAILGGIGDEGLLRAAAPDLLLGGLLDLLRIL